MKIVVAFQKVIVQSLSAAALGFTLSGCALSGGLSVDELTAIYGPIQPHWLKPVARIDHLLILGLVPNPATTGGRLVPTGDLGGTLVETRWMETVGLNRVDVYIKPFIPPGNIWDFGPKQGDPEGVYAFESHPADDPLCKDYWHAKTLAENESNIYLRNLRPSIGANRCLSFRYVGKLQLSDYEYVQLSYFDRSMANRGYGVLVSELRRGETEVVARTVACFVAAGLPRQPAGCPGNSDIMQIFNPQSR